MIWGDQPGKLFKNSKNGNNAMIEILLTLVVAGVLLWAVNKLPMEAGVKNLLNTVVLIILVVWLLKVFGLWVHLFRIHV